MFARPMSIGRMDNHMSRPKNTHSNFNRLSWFETRCLAPELLSAGAPAESAANRCRESRVCQGADKKVFEPTQAPPSLAKGADDRGIFKGNSGPPSTPS